MVDINANPGDYVKISMMKKEYKGVLLETPKDEKGIVMLKLDSGYNIGIIRKEIREIKVLEKREEVKNDVKIKQDESKPNIAMVITGGTIAARLNPRKGGVDWLDTPESLFKFYPGLFEKVNISKVEIPFMKASEDMDYKDWQKLARVVEKLLNDSSIKGVIITHGTDFLHYTSAALSFFLKDLNKPVVLTYSQKSIDRASSDANLNLQCSALVAISDIAEVMLVGHATNNDDYCYAMPGTKVRKMHTSRRDAFDVINSKPFAKVTPDYLQIISLPIAVPALPISHPKSKLHLNRTRSKGKVKLDLKFEEKVALVKIYPGQDPDILDYYVKKKYKGIILEMSGLGHAPTMRARKGWTQKLKEVQAKGLVVCATAQTIHGRLDPMVYSNGRELLGTGIIYLEDMLSETALVKLSWVLGHDDWNVKEKMLENISHELNDRLED